LQAVAGKATATLELLDEVDAELAKATELKSLREVLDRRWDSLQAELGALFESVSLGLTAEALSHEIHNIADGLAKRSAVLLRQLQSGEVRKATMVSYVEHVRSSVAGMRKQLAHLSPSLKYLREQREPIDLAAFLKELAAFHNDRLENRGITVEVLVSAKGTPHLSINRGKLTQVFDNLILNSDYWLREAIRMEHIKSGVISLTVEGPVVRLTDNGLGIDPIVEETLFDPFVTMKERREGRGLGLFVVRQLLDSEACTAVLLLERNAFSRRYIFELDFTGALCE
jgi:signal transduction histidine kinase